jgi:hypothetical protein
MEIMTDLTPRDEFINNFGRPLTFEERRKTNWAFRYKSKEEAVKYLEDIFKVKKAKTNKEEVS